MNDKLATTAPPPLGQVRDPRRELHRLLHRWLVLYNPFYFLSALSLLSGVYLISQHLEGGPVDWTLGYLGLVAALQVYELALIGCAAWLNRAQDLKRPAVILCMVESLLLLDPTFTAQVVAHLEPYDIGLTVLWSLLVPLKISAMAWALDLRIARPALLLVSAALAALVIVPTLLDGFIGNQRASAQILSLAVWSFAGFLLIWSAKPFEWVARSPLNPWGQAVHRRIQAAVRCAVPTAVMIHGVSWVTVYDLELLIHHLIPFLLVATWLGRGNAATWIAAVCAYAVASPDSPHWVALVLAIIFVKLAHDRKDFLLSCGAVTASYLGIVSYVQHLAWPESLSVLAAIGAAAAFLWIAWTHWQPWPLLPPILGLVDLIHDLYQSGLIHSLQMGLWLTAFAFLCLGLGVWTSTSLGPGLPAPSQRLSACPTDHEEEE